MTAVQERTVVRGDETTYIDTVIEQNPIIKCLAEDVVSGSAFGDWHVTIPCQNMATEYDVDIDKVRSVLRRAIPTEELASLASPAAKWIKNEI